MENAVGEGSARGRTGRLRLNPEFADGGSLGREAQCDASTSECTGKIVTISFPDGDLEEETARACVGYACWGCEPETVTGIIEGSCERGMELGIDLGRLEIPASILKVGDVSPAGIGRQLNDTYSLALGRRPRRMYSIGTLPNSGAMEAIASRETSAKAGRASERGSWTL